MKSLGRFLALLTLCCAISACDSEGRTRGPSTNVTVVHAAPSFPNIDFLREERSSADLAYRAAATLSFEVGPYDFNLETVPAGTSTPTRHETFAVDLAENTDYQFIIAETTPGTLEALVFSQPTFDTASAMSEVSVVHAADAFPEVDVYLTAAGADLSAANPIGSASFTGNVPAQTFAEGDYQLALTEPGDPLTVLFRASVGTLAAGQANLFVVTDGAGEGTVPVNVVRIAGGNTGVYTDVSATAGIRAINAADDALPRDVAVDGDFTTPLFAALGYGQMTDYVDLSQGSPDLSVTPAGNPGVVEGEETPTITRGRVYTTVISGSPGDLDVATTIEDRRRIVGQAQLRAFNGAGRFTSLDFFVLPPDSDITNFVPIVLGPSGSTSLPTLPPGSYELTVRITGTQTIALDPLPLTVEAGGIYGLVFLNGPTAETVDVLLIDDFE